MIKAIIFDFDGLILDTEMPEYLAWLGAYQDFGFDLPIHEWASIIGRGASTISKTPYDDLEERFGQPIDRVAVRAKRRTHFLKLMQEKTLLPGVQSLLDDAKLQGLPLGVASSSPRSWVVGYLEQLGIVHYFDTIHCGDEVALAKPDPELYLTALAALNVNAEEAVALEDSPNGVAAAKAAGIYCIAVPNELTRHTSLAHADMVIAGLDTVTIADIQQMAAEKKIPSDALPRWPKKILGAAAVIQDSNGRVLLVKHSYGRRNWEIPGGAVESEESVTDAAVREVFEETGMRVIAERLTGIYYAAENDSHHFVFLCRSASDDQRPRADQDETTDCAYFSIEALPRPISDLTIRRILDALSGFAPVLPIPVGTRQWLE
ncbi:MAG: family hydrolase [Capsulimonas sp.]|nr:family hydrolase [Capsulimonas sp.]